MEKFKIYSKLSPIICRGLRADQVLVAFHMKANGLFTAIGKEGRDQLIKEMPSIRSSMVSKIVYMLQYKGFPTTVGGTMLCSGYTD